MRFLLLIIAALIAYGSLYPFAFSLASADSAELRRLLVIDPMGTSRSDILANILLFLPFGLFGAAAAGRRRGGALPILLVLAVGLGFAALLQIAQLFLPSRTPSLTDVFWNGIGLLVGALAAGLPFVRRLLHGLERVPDLSVPAALIAAWLAYRLYPFAPSLDLQVVKDSLKPLLLYPRLTALGVLHDFVAWSIVLHFWAAMRLRGDRDRFALLLIAGSFLAEILIVRNVVSADNLAGALLAVVLWWVLLYRLPGRSSWLAALLLAVLVLQGLAPFQLRSAPAAFHWVPFAGALGGSSAAAMAALAEKLFLYGSLVWLLREMRFGWGGVLMIAAGALALIEVAQTRFAYHTPEITDPLIVVLMVLPLMLLSGGARAPTLSLSRRA